MHKRKSKRKTKNICGFCHPDWSSRLIHIVCDIDVELEHYDGYEPYYPDCSDKRPFRAIGVCSECGNIRFYSFPKKTKRAALKSLNREIRLKQEEKYIPDDHIDW